MKIIRKKLLSAVLAVSITVSSLSVFGAESVKASGIEIVYDESSDKTITEETTSEEPASDELTSEEPTTNELLNEGLTSESSDPENLKTEEATPGDSSFNVISPEDIKIEELDNNKLSASEDMAASNFDGFTKYTDDQKLYKNHIKTNQGGYIRPSADTILNDYKNSSQNGKHPRIMITKTYIDNLKTEVKTSGNPKAVWYNRLSSRADILCDRLKAGDTDYIFNYTKCFNTRMMTNDGITAADVFREDMMVLGMMYQLTGKTEYCDAAWILLKRLTDKSIFPDINPWHDLDFGFFCQGYAIAYDWMYSAWSDKQRGLLEEAIKRQCFRPANDSYTYNVKKSDQTSDNGIVGGMLTNHNHNAIVNSGVVMVSMALMDKYPAITSSLCHDAFICLEIDLNTYAQGGLNIEGTEYMFLTMDNLAMLFSTMESSLGKNKLYGLDTCPGLKDGKFIKALYSLSSDVGQLSYSDTYDRLITTGGELYFDKHYGIHGFRKKIYDRLNENYNTDYTKNVQILCWYEADTNSTISLSKDFVSQGDAAVATFRSDFGNRQSFAGVKAGTTLRDFYVHLDQGSFMFNALGVRWTSDLGKDRYSLTGYESPKAEDNRRFKIFRLRPDGHNTLLINPKTTDMGYEFEKTATIKTSAASSQAMAVVDMTSLVSTKATTAKRGILLTDDRKNLVVRDEVNLKNQSDLYWVMYTQNSADNISISGNTALITAKNIYGETVYLKMEFASSLNGTLKKQSAAPWNLAPTISGQKDNDDYTRIVYEIKGAKGNVNITVKLTPQKQKNETDSTPKPSDYGAISTWDVNKAFTRGGWKKENGNWYYYKENVKKTGWIQDNGKWYYLDPSTGIMKTGWIKISGYDYYMGPSGDMRTGWFKDNGKWYYLNPTTGAMRKNNWVQTGGKWYYLKSDGSMAVNEWVDGGKYHVNGNGVWDN